MTNRTNTGYFDCHVLTTGFNAGNIDVANCSYVHPTQVLDTYKPYGVAVSGNYLYLITATATPINSDYIRCQIDGTGVVTTGSCTNIMIPDTPVKLNKSRGLAFKRNFAYFTNYIGNSYTKCGVDGTGLIDPATWVKVTPYL